ncbi:hypothetical protein B566_EDAN011803 [Ephemera danica]|nr:hypothetical protein B566_EDAN011803 [Ephemera danica]
MAVGRRAHLGMALVCGSCRQRFHSAVELQRHRASALCRDDERYGCPHCSKDFGNRQILRLHMRVHEECTTPVPPQPLKPTTTESPTGATSSVTTGLTVRPMQPTHPRHPYGKKIGFTKIRLEDCLRCDECSCVYMYESDYLKHMRNFHRQNSPRKSKQKKGCRSCCRHCNCRDGVAPQPSVETERGNNNLFHFNIKDRWSKVVSRRLTDIAVKEDPDGDEDPGIDLSHLLSQVEVKIKTEPPDDYCPDYMLPVPLANIKTEPVN